MLSIVMEGVLGGVDSHREIQMHHFPVDWMSAMEISSPSPASEQTEQLSQVGELSVHTLILSCKLSLATGMIT